MKSLIKTSWGNLLGIYNLMKDKSIDKNIKELDQLSSNPVFLGTRY
jgi:hypothetical protein